MKTTCHHLIPRLAALALGALSLVTLPRLAPAQAVFTKLGDFDGDNGENPDYGVIFGADGNLYGVTTNGGSTTDSQGCVFRCSPTGGSLTRVAEFTSAATGFHPMGGLLLAKDGNFYGTTNAGDGDQHSDGTIFRLAPAGTLTTIHVFQYNADDMMYDMGRAPAGALIQGSDGLLYGQCTLGGLQGENDPQGTLFKFDPGTSVLQSHSLNGGVFDAADPHTRMVEVMPGVFYGASLAGGQKGDGTIYRFTSDLEEKVEYFFDADGPNPAALPASGLTIGSDGKLYGTTEGSGTQNLGVYYRYNLNGGYEELGSFTGTANGSQPVGEMVLATDGNLYGVTFGGGSNDFGTIFRLTTAGVLTTVFDFGGPGSDVNGINYGLEPEGALVQGADGRLYGTAHGGGVNNLGAVFAVSLNPVITSAATASATVGQPFSYQIVATNTPTKYGFQGNANGLTINSKTGVISGIPKATGTYTYTINAYNGMGKGSVTLTLTVKAAAPVITSATTASGNVGAAFSYQIMATGAPTSYGFQGNANGLTINPSTGLIAGKPKAAGTFTYTINAYNGAGKGSQTLTVTITLTAPVITSATSASGTVGKAFSYQIVATGAPTSYGFQGNANGLSINNTTGVISGTPKAAGTFTYTLNAYNSKGKGSATLTVTITSS